MLSAERAPAFPTAILQDISFLNFQNDRLDNSIVYYGVMNYKSNHDVVYSCKYHVVWCPKYRRRVLIDGVDERLKAIIQEVLQEHDAELMKMEIMADFVHLLIEVDPQYGIHRLVKQIKGRSSRLLREEFPWLRKRLPSLWTNSYFVSTTGHEPLTAIKQYIQNQKSV
jgi:putative transposase